MVAYARCKVKSIRRINKEFVEVTFERPLPEGVRAGHVVAADDIYPDVTISGCRMRGNRARGLLLGSRGHVVVEDSYFHITGAAILFEGDARYWYEQSGVRDVTICDCIFENCNYGSRSWGAACIAVGSGIVQRSGTRYHRGIRLERNIFRAFDSRIVNIYCVDGFLFAASNRVERTYDYPCRNFTENDMFVTDECDNVQIEFFGVSE